MTGSRPPGARIFRVLIVEDQPAIRFALSRYFTRRHWLVEEMVNGKEALEKLRLLPLDHYDLIISDVKMPVVSGIELHSVLSDEMPELLSKFVFSTGDASSEDVSEFISRTNCTVIPKPFELSLLDTILNRIEQAGA
jgi:two-component system, response regulator YesN